MVTFDGLALEYVDNLLKADPEVVKAAVTQNGLALQFSRFTKRLEISLIAVQQNGLALQWVSTKFQENQPVIVKAAVTQNGLALQYASPTLQRDGNIVQAAISQKWLGSSMGLNKISRKSTRDSQSSGYSK